jgi:hypothetical protein
MDKLKQSEQKNNLRVLADLYDTRIMPVSVLKNAGLDEVWKFLLAWVR